MWKLVIEDDEGKRTVVPLSREDYTIGRQEGNTIRLTERNVSRTHGRVRRKQNGAGSVFVLEDLRSYNGVFVNGLRVAHTQDLQHGDLIQIGDYRIVLQDDAAVTDTAAITVTVDPSDAKATIPIAAAVYRGQTLTERPNRLVMLVGPTPGVEYPLDRERLSVGRAEDANISVNHNSVSRLHCEIHALGDGRFEIVDKGSSNGVRVNAVELRRSIIEAGDVIELGDVRFKFVGAGQIFVPGPNESQQLTAISDREAELVSSQRRGVMGYLVPVLGAGIFGAAIILAVAWLLQNRGFHKDPIDAAAATADPDQAMLLDAKKACSVDDCEQGHTLVAALPESSRWHGHADAQWVMTTWAESLLRKARGETDTATRGAILSRILAEPRVDGALKARARELQQAGPPGESLSAPEPPVTSSPATPAVKDGGALATMPVQPRTMPTSHTTVTNATTSAPRATEPKPEPSSAKAPPGASDFERAQQATVLGNYGKVRQILEAKARSQRIDPDEARLAYAACKLAKDQACKDDIRKKNPDAITAP